MTGRWDGSVATAWLQRHEVDAAALRQYFIDRDGHPVLTADGRPVHVLVNEHGDEVRDAEGRSIGPVEIPPGCRVKARHERD